MNSLAHQMFLNKGIFLGTTFRSMSNSDSSLRGMVYFTPFGFIPSSSFWNKVFSCETMHTSSLQTISQLRINLEVSMLTNTYIQSVGHSLQRCILCSLNPISFSSNWVYEHKRHNRKLINNSLKAFSHSKVFQALFLELLCGEIQPSSMW